MQVLLQHMGVKLLYSLAIKKYHMTGVAMVSASMTFL